MGIVEIIKGELRAELCGACPQSVLNAAARSGIELKNIEYIDEVSIRFSFYEKELERTEEIAQRCMCRMRIIRQTGGSRVKKLLRRRWGLLAGIIAAFALLILSSLFIWEIEIRGGDTISRGDILRALSDAGVEYGSFWPSLSVDIIRSEVMSELPEIAWMAINVSGSRALVRIEERKEKPEIYSQQSYHDIRAVKTGIIKRISVLNGRACVQSGDAVTKGELLISGAMDSITNGTRNVAAKGSVIADTWYELTAVTPEEEALKKPHSFKHKRFAIQLGKKRINLYPDGGKTIDGYDKIIREYKLGVKGLFCMPVRLISEELIRYDSASGRGAVSVSMRERLSETLREQVCGEIVTLSFSEGCAEGLVFVTLRAHCTEEIGG